MKPWEIVFGSAVLWWSFFICLFVFSGKNVQVTCFPVMGLFLRAADHAPHLGYEDKDFYFTAVISFSAFATLGTVAIWKKSMPLAITFAVLLSISSFLAMMPTIEA